MHFVCVTRVFSCEFLISRGRTHLCHAFNIYFIGDSKSGNTYTGESITKNQKVTKSDHNGTIYILTEEIGYGGESATFNSENVKKYDSVTLDFNGDKIVDGFVDIWKIDNVTSGDFSSISISTNGTGVFKTGINIL